MTATEREKSILKHMALLKCTREEAEEIVACDERIDKGEKLFELTPEQEKASKKARAIGTKTTTATPKATTTKRERKADNDKAMLIDEIKNAIEGLECVEGVEVTNAEREMLFYCNGRKFKIVLSAPRS